MTRNLYLLDDAEARRWEPFAATRPVGEILHGALLQRERIERAVGVPASGYLGPAELEGFGEEGAPPVLTAAPSRDEARIVLSTRYVPPLPDEDASAALPIPRELPPDGLRLTAGGTPVGWALPAGASLPPGRPGYSGTPAEEPLPEQELPGSVLPDPWTLVARNAERIAADLRVLFPGGEAEGVRPLEETPGVFRLGDHPVSVAHDVEVEPGTVLDTRGGPIHLAAGVKVRSPSRLEGPAWIGPGSVLMGGAVGALSCGPVCKLHGEIDSCVVLGYANKAHDGYLGHALLGRWVNLGAMTTNSDLKNTYGPVRVAGPGGHGEIETGLLKVGVFLGDHVKTGIGTLLNTGSIVGAGSSLVAGPLPPRWVPPFSWGRGDRLGVYRKEPFFTTAERVMARREVALGEGTRRILARLWDRTHGARGSGAPGASAAIGGADE